MIYRIVLLFGILCLSTTAFAANWKMSGNDTTNARYQKSEKKIGIDNVDKLQVEWEFTLAEGASGTPAVEGKHVYIGDWAGNIYKLNVDKKKIVWQSQVSEYTGFPGDWTRGTLTIAGNKLIFGNHIGRIGQGGAKLVAVNKKTGDLEWVTQLDGFPSAVITSSPTVKGNTAYVGVSSLEEATPSFVPNYNCCYFRGSVAAVDLKNGNIKWQTYTTPDPLTTGWSGNAVWGSSPVVDKKRKQVYVATGNNYSAPQLYFECIAAASLEFPNDAQAQARGDAQAACNPEDNYFDSVVALDMKTGKVNWANRVQPYDTWIVDCSPILSGGFQNGACGSYAIGPEGVPGGPDFDFGQAPILHKVSVDSPGKKDKKGKKGKKGKTVDRLSVGQKSGWYYSIDPDNGDLVWKVKTGPGGLAGGHQWGGASDGDMIYTSNANSFGFMAPPWELIGGGGATTNSGIFSGINALDGSVAWQTANPAGPFGFAAMGGQMSTANGVAYGCSQDANGTMFALDGATGDVLWDFPSGVGCNSGAAIANGKVYWTTGYPSFGAPPPPDGSVKLYVFALAK